MRHKVVPAALLSFVASLLSACGGGGGNGGGQSTPAPTVTLSADPAAISAGQSSTLTWSSTNATSCTASAGWSGARATSGTEQVASIAATTTFTLACSGAGGTTTQSATVTVTGGGAGDVVVSGRITFDRVPFRTPPQQGLDPNNPVESPARQVVVEAIDAGNGSALAATTTDGNGSYALTVPGNRNMRIRARAQMVKADAAPTWTFSVRNNTNSDALYVLDGENFNSGAASSTRNLRATTGWGGTSYTGTRAAAPFAILDTVFQAKELILTAAPTAALPELNLFWSDQNRPATPFCPDDGNIGTSSYVVFGSDNLDGCNRPGADGIYVLGEFAGGNGDTDEFDQHVIAHEFGHYFEDRFSRSDSIGGDHGGSDLLDLRLAFGEGWGNAYAAMSLNDAAYRDSQQGVSSDFGFSLETDNTANEGWFSEFSVGEILFDVFDTTADGADAVALGFAPIYSVMTAPQVQTSALTSIFSFATALRSGNSGSSAAINDLLSGEGVSGSDEFGAGETNDGGDSGAQGVLPVYRDIFPGTPVVVCSRATAGSGDAANKLGNRKFLRLVLGTATAVVIQAAGVSTGGATVAATDPDIFVHRRGSLVAVSNETGSTETTPQLALPADTYIIEVYDFELVGTTTISRCMNVSVQG
jgi:hypothetical protein